MEDSADALDKEHIVRSERDRTVERVVTAQKCIAIFGLGGFAVLGETLFQGFQLSDRDPLRRERRRLHLLEPPELKKLAHMFWRHRGGRVQHRQLGYFRRLTHIDSASAPCA